MRPTRGCQKCQKWVLAVLAPRGWGHFLLFARGHPRVDEVPIRRTTVVGVTLYAANPPGVFQNIQGCQNPVWRVEVRPVVAIDVPHSERAIRTDCFGLELRSEIRCRLHRGG